MEDNTASNEALISEFNRQSARLKKGMTMAEGGQGAENAYAAAYHQMARAGLVQPLRKKYRGR